MVRITDTAFRIGKVSHVERADRDVRASLDKGEMTEQDAHLIKAHISEISAYKNISGAHIYSVTHCLRISRRFLPHSFATCTTEDVFFCLQAIYNSKYSKHTQSLIITFLKRFLLWLCESGYNTTINANKIRKISLPSHKPSKTADDILTPEQVDAIISAGVNPKERAILSLLYESGGRGGEIATLTWKQITYYSTHATVTLDGKTGKPRVIPLLTSHVALKIWFDNYPGGAAPEKLIFPSTYPTKKGQVMAYESVLELAKRCARNAGITKKVTLHTFRHSRITHLLQAGVSESSVKLLAWGSISTNMLSVYAHLTPSDAERELCKVMGVNVEKQFGLSAEVLAAPIQCKQCCLINPKTSRFCAECGEPLTQDAKTSIKEVIGFIEDRQTYASVKDQVTRILKEMGIVSPEIA